MDVAGIEWKKEYGGGAFKLIDLMGIKAIISQF